MKILLALVFIPIAWLVGMFILDMVFAILGGIVRFFNE